MIERLGHWWAMLRHYWRELAIRWYCWQHNCTRLARAIIVHSIRVGNVEQLLGEVPGLVFAFAEPMTPPFRAFGQAGWGISVVVENISAEPVLFVATVMFRSLVTDGLEAVSFAPGRVDTKHQMTFCLPLPCAAEVLSLRIPTYIRRAPA